MPPAPILAAIDSSPLAEQVLDRAVAQARLVPGTELHLVHVVDSLPIAAASIGGSPLSTPSAEHLIEEGREVLERLIARAQTGGELSVKGHLEVGVPSGEVPQLARSLGADMIVVGTHDPGNVERFFLGSVAERIAREAHCSVLIVRQPR
jgi:nucleotide-binding universal stress UspA family protein